MSDTITAAPVTAPVATAAPGSPIHVSVQMPPPKEKAPKAAKPDGEPADSARDAQVAKKAQRQMLKQMGVPKDERDGFLAEIQAGRKKLGEVTKVAADAKAQIEALKPYQERTAQLETALKEFADQAFSELPEPVQKFIAGQKVEDPAARLAMIKQMRDAGMITPKQAADASTAVAKVESKGAATTLAANNPAAAKAGATLNHYEQWQAMKSAGDRMGAAAFRKQFAVKIEEQTPASK